MERAFSDLPVAILCGGKATRLGDLTKTTPKSLLDVNGRPFIHWQIDLLREQGLKNIVLCCGHLAGGFFWRMGDYNVAYTFDGGQLGTGGAIKNALNLLGPEFFVLYGDSYLPIDYKPIWDQHRASGKLATMSTWLGVDFGMNIFNREAFGAFSGTFDIHEVFNALRQQDQLAIYQSPSRFYEIGTPESLEEVRQLLK